MIDHRLNSCHPQVLVIALVAMGLLFAGMRLPDISRPHRPKPTHRVLLESHHKNISNHLKQCADLFAVPPRHQTITNRILLQVVYQAAPPLYLSLLRPPNSARSPPALT